MRDDTSRILNEWASVLEFNPDQKSFDLGNFSLDIHIAGETMKKLIEKFDESGELSVLYAKQFYMNYLKHLYYHTNNLLSSHDELAVVGAPIERHMWNSDEMKEVREKLGESDYMNHRLECCIGFSKRGLNKLIKDPSIVIKYEEGNIVIDNKED